MYIKDMENILIKMAKTTPEERKALSKLSLRLHGSEGIGQAQGASVSTTLGAPIITIRK